METWAGDTRAGRREGAGHSGLEELGVQWTGDKHPGPLLANLAGPANRSEEGEMTIRRLFTVVAAVFFGENG